MASQGILNQSLFEDHQDHHMSSSIQMGFFSSNFPQNYSNNIPYGCSNINQPILRTIPSSSSDEQQQPLPYNTNNNNTLSQSSSSTLIKLQKDIDFTSNFGGGPYQHQILSLQRSSPNLWSWGEVNYDCMSSKRNTNGGENISHLGISAIKMKKIKARRKVREPRFCFKTLSDVDVLDDGYKWRKYGQKVVKNTQHPRSYYRCTQDNCRVKKRVERLAEDPRMVITTYEGRHIHSPSHDEEDSQASSQVNSYFW